MCFLLSDSYAFAFVLQETLGYKEALMDAFEATNNWNEVASWSNLNANKKKVCIAVGACEKESFVFQTKPLTTIQEHWDDKCLVCQAFAYDLEVWLLILSPY